MAEYVSSPLTLDPSGGNSVKAISRRILRTLGPSVLGVLFALGIGAILILLSGSDPIVAYQIMLKGAFGGPRQLTETILKATPLLLIGLGLTVAFRARVWNIGAEGQYFIGALFGSFVALQFSTLPPVIVIPATLVAGIIGGAVWGFIPALLRTWRGVSEIITTLMFNYIAIFVIEYVARVPLRDPDGFLPETAQFDKAVRLSGLFNTRIHPGVFLVLALIPIVYVLIWRTPIGFRLRAVGSKTSVARFVGIYVNRSIVFVLIISGGMAGMAGIMEVSFLHSRLKGGISGGYGFTAILVALLGRLHPVGVLFAALFFSALDIGADTMHTFTGLPISLADTIQALVVLFVVGFEAYFRYRRS